ncbi:hypothetical protein IRJ41_004552 [Triplophysa rosa]|uniref:RNase H type-1 domain-containing protein n=1 Tax=Triplophysa rosa TaxID=992332 RepID=A0A9W7T3V1_TRIRA|nr:hypothetical protein IRJ41_004552 [Triplophysa rosa]
MLLCILRPGEIRLLLLLGVLVGVLLIRDETYPPMMIPWLCFRWLLLPWGWMTHQCSRSSLMFFFRQSSAGSTFAMPPCKDFVAEFSTSLTGSNVSKRRSKAARTLASMADADAIGVGRAPELEQPVAALVVSPDVRCPSAHTSMLESASVDPSVSQFLQNALLAIGHVTRELGALTATLLAGRRHVWLAQAKLPEDCKRTLRDLPIVPGHLFRPNVPELLEKRLKLSEATRQLTQPQRTPVFKVPSTQACHRFAGPEQRFRQHSVPQPQGSQCQGVHVSSPPLLLKAELTKLEVMGPVVDRFSSLHLQSWKDVTVDPWVWTTLSRGEVVTTDASLLGWGASWNHRGVCGRWSPAWSRDHINLLELRAVFLALQCFLPVLAGCHVLIRSDNTSTVFHLNHQGETRSLKLLHLTRRILTWSLPRLASLKAVHLPGSHNQVADALSRDLIHPGEWRLHPDVVQMIWQRFGEGCWIFSQHG